MTKVAITEQYLTDIADAIRAKSGTSGGMTPADMASAISNIPSGGGGSSYTLLHSEVVTVSTTSTSNKTVKEIQLDKSKYTQDQMIYVRVRDTAGPRTGYFYGSDAFFIDADSINDRTAGNTISAHRCIIVNSSSKYDVYNPPNENNYGVFGYSLKPYINTPSGGKILIRSRYNSSMSRTIDSDYRIDIFAIDSPDNLPFLEPL